MSTFTLDLNDTLSKAYSQVALKEEDSHFYNYRTFHLLEEGDLVCLPFNLRAGVYRVSRFKPLRTLPENTPITWGLARCSIIVPLIHDERNQGLWLKKLTPGTVNFDLWDGCEETLSTGHLFGNKCINWSETESYSNWYDYPDWVDYYPLSVFDDLPESTRLYLSTYYKD